MQTYTESESTTMLRRTRSPGYPSTDLRDAVEKAEALWEKVGKHEAGRDVVAEVWKFSSTSSAVPQYLAALKRYGLLEDVGEGKRRLVRLTPLAVKIIAHGPNSPERNAAIKTAALKPGIFVDLMNRYGDNLSVADSLIKSYLIADLDFNKDAASGLIKSFRVTVTFAGLTSLDSQTEKTQRVDGAKIEGENASSGNIVVDNPSNANTMVSSTQSIPLNKTPENMREFTLPMPNGGIYIRVPKAFSEADFKTLKLSLDLFKSWLVSSDKETPSDATTTADSTPATD